jgi:hypothetical protein
MASCDIVERTAYRVSAFLSDHAPHRDRRNFTLLNFDRLGQV